MQQLYMFDRDSFGEALSRVKRERLASFRGIEDRTGVSYASIEKICNRRGKTKVTHAHALLAKWAGLNLSDFLHLEDQLRLL